MNGPEFNNNDARANAMCNGKDRVITLREAAEILRVSYPTINRMANSGEIFAFRVNGGWRTSTAICRQYLAKQMKRQQEIWLRGKRR